MNAIYLLKRVTILFWALWFTCAWSSNFFDLLKHANWVSSSWMFVSGNMTLVENVLSIYKLPPVFSEILFIGVLVLEAIIVCLFWAAFFTFNRRANLAWVNRAFLMSTALWALFLVTEEIFIAYLYEQTHLLLLLAQIICLMMIYAIPHENESAKIG